MLKPVLSKQGRTKKGRFTPINPQKYSGNHKTILYRSGWERKVMIWCDNSSHVVAWNSEEVVIPYKSLVDRRWHRYFLDFVIRMKTKTGEVTVLVDVKPEKDTKSPIGGTSKSTGRYRMSKRLLEYSKNLSKWQAAIKYAEDNKVVFEIRTERVLKKLGIM